MIKIILILLIFLSIVFGSLNGRIAQVNSAALKECTNAVSLSIALAGTICLWNGLMRVAEKSGLTKIFSRLLSPITGLLFKGISKTSHTMQLITMNIAANMLGLGNAATPLGISAMTELEKDIPNDLKDIASDNMIVFVVLNTASIQLIPTTVAALRLKYGSENPLDILFCVFICSLISLSVALFFAKLMNRFFPAKKRKD